MTTDPMLRGLDADQREAVTTDAAPLAIIAAAGSGKTTVLTRRIAFRAAQGSALPQHVLALTFTRDAASELKRRLRRLEIREPVTAGTFHSVALGLLRDRALAANQSPPHVANDRLRLVREVITEQRLQVEPYAALTDLDWARARMVTPDRYEGAVRLSRRRSAVPPARFADVAAAYERLKRRRGVVDFDDLLAGTIEAMDRDRPWADGVRWRFRHFFVDEVQDLNPLQHALLESLRDGRPDVCLVGDPRQAIYGWNGADPAMLDEVERLYPAVTVVRLTSNYRCSPQVVRAGAAALSASGQIDDTASRQPDGAAVSVREFDDEVAEAEAVARHVRDLLHHRRGNEVAVLARTNEQLTALQRALTAVGVETERGAGRSPLDAAIRSAYRCTTREQLAKWVDEMVVADDEFVRRVAEEADRFLASGQAGTFRGWVELRDPFHELDPGDTRDSVALLTFHAAKGREWAAVVLVGAEEGLVPHGSSSSVAQLAEEARLFYVAITRAAHQLLITHCARRQQRPVAASRWLQPVLDSAAGDRPVPPPARPARPPDPMAPYREWRAAVARVAGQPEQAVCTDRVLRTLAAAPPGSIAELAERLGITETAAARLRPLPTTA